MNPYSIVIIRTRQILATGLTLGEAKAETKRWNRASSLGDCATWEPAPAGIRFREGGGLRCEEDEQIDRDQD